MAQRTFFAGGDHHPPRFPSVVLTSCMRHPRCSKMNISSDCALLDIFKNAQDRADHEMDEYYNGLATRTTQKLSILKSGHSAGNFVYGEVSFESFLRVLQFCTKRSDHTFVDCGCGAGVTLAVCGLFSGSSISCQNFKRIIGIDLMSSKVMECRALLRIMAELDSSYERWLDVEVLENDFVVVDWSDADVVYACATCFSEQMFALFVAKLCHLKRGSRVLVMDKQIASDASDSMTYLLLSSMSCETTWGTGIMFIYEKT